MVKYLSVAGKVPCDSIVEVESFPIWDYKILDNKLILISEKVAGSTEFESISWKELEDYVITEGVDTKELEIVSERVDADELSFKKFTVSGLFLNFEL